MRFPTKKLNGSKAKKEVVAKNYLLLYFSAKKETFLNLIIRFICPKKSFRERMNEMNEQGFLYLCPALKEIFIGEIKKQS